MRYVIDRDKVIISVSGLSNSLDVSEHSFDYVDGYYSAIRDAVDLIAILKC